MEWRAYGYDGFGRLDFEAGSTTPPVPGEIATSMLYQDGEHIVAESKGTGFSSTTNGTNIVNWYTYSDATDDLLAITPRAAANAPNTPNGGTSFSAPSQTAHYSVHTDHQGSVRAITDQTKQIVNAYAYDAYGNAEEAVESLSQRFRYTGREWDGVARLYHYRARAYDAETGRFLQEDPLWFNAGDLNVYRYVGNNPVNATDPSGMLLDTGGQQSIVTRTLLLGRTATQSMLSTGTRTARYIASTGKNNLSSITASITCTFHILADALNQSGPNTKIVGVDVTRCGVVAMSEPDMPPIWSIPDDRRPRGRCACRCRAGGQIPNKGNEWDWRFSTAGANSCPQAAIAACDIAIKDIREKYSSIHHVRAVCTDGNSYSGGGVRN